MHILIWEIVWSWQWGFYVSAETITIALAVLKFVSQLKFKCVLFKTSEHLDFRKQ